MTPESRVSILSFSSASATAQATGLLGWLSLEVGGLFRIDGLTLRRTGGSNSRLALSFPAPRDQQGKSRRVVRPLSDQARREIERQVFEILGVGEVTP